MSDVIAHVIKTPALAKLHGISRSAMWGRAQENAALAGCIVHRSKRTIEFSVQRLRDRGFLTRPEPKAEASCVGFFSYAMTSAPR